MLEITKFACYAHKAIGLLSEVIIGARTPDDPAYCSTEYSSWLEQIERRICSIRQELQLQRSLSDLGDQSESVAIKEVFVIATFVYFERKSKQLVGASSKTDEWIEDGFKILAKLESCNKSFPLFIFGREARVESRRLLILQMIDKSMKNSTVSSLSTLRHLLLKLWIQDDLDIIGDGDDQRKGCWIIRNSDFVQCLF